MEYKVNGVIITVNLTCINELRDSYKELELINLDSVQSLLGLTRVNVDIIIIDVDMLDRMTVDQIMEIRKMFKCNLIFTSESRTRLVNFDGYGETVLKKVSILIGRILQILLEKKQLVFEEIAFDMEHRIVFYQGQAIRLRNAGFLILRYLVEHKGRACTRSELLGALGTVEQLSESRTIDVHINYIRRSIPGINLCTVINQGYLYNVVDDEIN